MDGIEEPHGTSYVLNEESITQRNSAPAFQMRPVLPILNREITATAP